MVHKITNVFYNKDHFVVALLAKKNLGIFDNISSLSFWALFQVGVSKPVMVRLALPAIFYQINFNCPSIVFP